MFRKFFNRVESGKSESEGSASKLPTPTTASESDTNQQAQIDSRTVPAQQLAPFDACIEACDQLASTSTSAGRHDPLTGLLDLSVLVSADGDLLIIPQEQQAKSDSERSSSYGRFPNLRSVSFVRRTASELGEEYSSGIFMGNDLQTDGDKALNGFSTKGWSVPAASLALKQSADVMGDLADFVEDLVLSKKSCAAQENQTVNGLRRMVEGPEHGGLRVNEYQTYLKDTFPDETLDVLPTRVGPLSSKNGTIQATVVALEHYYSTTAESESRRWKRIADKSGPLSKLKVTKAKTDQRVLIRQLALQEICRKTKAVEGHLTACKEDGVRKWDAVHKAEEKVTELLEEKMMERSRLREKQRLEQIKEDEEKRRTDAAHGNLGATSSEIWDIVSAVTASMEEGSFQPMDLPQAPLVAPRDKSHGDEPVSGGNVIAEEEEKHVVPVASRHELEVECRLPELRAAALAADEAINDAANSLLKVLSNLDITNRSARLSAETCLVDASNAQAECLRAIIGSEKESLRERLKLLDELEVIAHDIGVRSDIDNYIILDKQGPGGRNAVGDDDDGGVAAALTVLDNHIDGDMGLGNSSNSRQSINTGDGEHDSVTAEHLEKAVDKFFQDDPLLHADAPDDEKTRRVQEEFEVAVLQLCKIGKEKSSSGRSRRSNICFSLNAKRSNTETVPSGIQFDGLCRVFFAILSGCDTQVSGVSLAKMMMTLSTCFYSCEGPDGKKVYVKNSLMKHPLWENEEFW